MDKCCERPNKKHVFCVNTHVEGETKKVVRKRARKAAKILKRWIKTGKLPMTQPEGVNVWPNHGSGGGP